MAWLDSTDFPSGGGGEHHSLWVHPVTQSTYFFDTPKNSWKSLASTGARLYSGTTDPKREGIVLMDGDLWWDSHALELRVFHLPNPKDGDQSSKVNGYWVSSTNPEMSLEDVNRNNVIGTVTIEGNDKPFEGEEVQFTVTHTGSNKDEVDYKWVVSPDHVTTYGGTDDEVVIPIAFLDNTQPLTTITFPEGTAVFDGKNQVKFKVTCTVSAKEPETFVRPVVVSNGITVKPVPKVSDSIQYINTYAATSGEDPIYAFSTGSTNAVVNLEGGVYSVSGEYLWPNFFIIPETSVADTDQHQIQISTKPKGDDSGVLLGRYLTNYGTIADIDGGQANGYLVQIDSQPQNRPEIVLYFWNDVEGYEFTGTLTLLNND